MARCVERPAYALAGRRRAHDEPMADERVLGVDACKGGWVGVLLTAGEPTAHFGATIGELLLAAEAGGPLDVVAIDIPIGLPDAGLRQADVLAFKAIGMLAPAVFMTPTRSALEALDHAAASAVNKGLTGRGISAQAFALKPKLFQVNDWVAGSGRRVVEIHPEVSFAQLAGEPLRVRKSTWAGVERRRQLLAGAGIVLAGELGLAGIKAGVDDVLDAGVAAWSARRVARGEARCRPNPPEVFSDGWLAAIWS